MILRSDYSCAICSQGKLVIKPSPSKVIIKSLSFLQRIQRDICGLIHPPCGPFRYFMVLIDASTRWSHVCLLFASNVAFARLLAQIIRAEFLDYLIQYIQMDNAGEFSSQAFYDYCMSISLMLNILLLIPNTQNGLVESFIKLLSLIARPLLMKSKLPIFAWGHAILHAASLVQIRPTSYQKYSPLQLAFGQPPNIFHFSHFWLCYICSNCSTSTYT
jgi:hypothetical protein